MRWLFALLLTGCGSGLADSVRQASERVYATCGLYAAPVDVHLVEQVECPGHPRAVGCAWTAGPRRGRVEVLASHPARVQVLTHELLHLLGARHVPAGHGLMGNPLDVGYDRITRADLADVPCAWVRPE